MRSIKYALFISFAMSKVKVGVLKMGAIGTAVILEYLLDERADREDIEVRVVTSGAKMQP